MECDFLIIGQGIAGSTLALELMKRGSKVLVVDRGDPGSSSRVAAGLVTPLTGKGLNAAWRQREYLPIAEQFYRDLEKRTGEKVYYTTEVRRLLRTEAEETKWQKKLETHAEWGNLVETSKDDLDLGHGVISMPRGAWLDTKKLIEVIRKELEREGAFYEADFCEGDVTFHSEGCQWQHVTAKKIILCQGAYGLGNGGWFGDVAHRCAKGEILTLKIEGLEGDKRYHADGWLAAREDGTWKAGATYDWKNLNSEPTEDGRDEVLGKISTWCNRPLEVVGHEAGIRPIIRNSRPVMGFHDEYKQLGFFNGLGSKGTLMAPATASHFADVLTGKCEQDPELSMTFPQDSTPSYLVTSNLLQKAHALVTETVKAGDTVIDATMGNGHDTLFLTSLVGSEGEVIGFDIQEQAVESTRQRLLEAGVNLDRVTLHCASHAVMNELVPVEKKQKVTNVMFNLGYLPGADKSLITKVKVTLEAISQAIEYLQPNGLLSVMCYPGHEGGDTEAAAVKKWLKALPKDQFSVEHYVREGHRPSSPFLLVARKK